jgi:hypothetical protein
LGFTGFVTKRPDLEALFSVAEFAVISILLYPLSFTLFSFVTPDDTACCRSKNSMVRGVMARCATNDSAFNAALRLCRGHTCQREDYSRTTN